MAISGGELKGVVGVGASAGGIEACERVLAAIEPGSGLAFVVVLHLSPDHASRLPDLLQSSSRLPVVEARDGEQLEPDTVYVIPPDASLRVRSGRCALERPLDPQARGRLVDVLFDSLAAELGPRAIAVVLSGGGSDGSAGAARVADRGGFVVVQDPREAEHAGMPESAIGTGVAEAIVLAREIPAAIVERVRSREESGGLATEREPSAAELEPILAILGERYDVDFREYKSGTLGRRIRRRMDLMHVAAADEYAARLRESAAEVKALFDDVLIGVTRFFRDPWVWSAVEETVLPALVAAREGDERTRIWVPGCATGQEAYTVALLVLEGLEAAGRPRELQMFGTDIDDAALDVARAGVYPAAIADEVPRPRLERFFEPVADGFRVRRELRDAITFARHNLLANPPFNNVDLISCRNVLIYLRQPTQDRITEVFHFALRPGGHLLLGPAESLGKSADLFEPLDPRARIFRRAAATRPRWSPMRTTAPARMLPADVPLAGPRARLARRVEEAVLKRYTAPCVVTNRALEILFFFGDALSFLQQPSHEARLDLLSWTPAGLYAPLRRALQEGLQGRARVDVEGVALESESGARRVACTVEPLYIGGTDGLLAVTFRELSDEGGGLVGASGDVHVEELQRALVRTQDDLRRTIEELRAAEDAHRSSHEEMLSLNEELQSSNEELQTSQEELQSVNEELDTVNQQLHATNDELRALFDDLNNLLVSAKLPVLFVDEQLRVRLATPAVADVARLRPEELPRPLEDVKLRCDDRALLDDVRRVLREGVQLTVDVGGEGGLTFERTAQPYRDHHGRAAGVCLTFIDVTEVRRAARDSDEALRFTEAIVRTVPTGLLVLDDELRVLRVNERFRELFRLSPAATDGKRIYELGDGEWEDPRLRELLERVLPERQSFSGYELTQELRGARRRVLRLDGNRMLRPERPPLILLSVDDITAQRAAEERIDSYAADLELADRQKDEFLAMLGHELRNPLAAIAQGVRLLGMDGAAERLPAVRAMLERQTTRITTMVDQLLDVARVMSGKIVLDRHPVDVGTAVSAGLEALAPLLAREPRELSFAPPEAGQLVVLGDVVRLGQIAENLIGNAVKYSRPGDQVAVSVAPVDDDRVALRVRDTGMGIDPELLPQIFEPFTQQARGLDRSRGGLGLGLALVRGLVALHGGEVRVHSDGPGKGTEVVVTLPRFHEEPAAAVAGERGAARRSQRVLVVDDERDIADGLVHLLVDRGHEAWAAHSGEDALRDVEQKRPDLVLLDLGLPGADGYDVARRIRAAHPGDDVKLVAVTGHRRDDERLREAGFDGHVLKPAALESLDAWLDGEAAP